LMTIVSGNNGLLYFIFPKRALVMALEVLLAMFFGKMVLVP